VDIHGIGVYIHAPYCVGKCSYCAFASERIPDDTTVICAALETEFTSRAEGLEMNPATFYAGGGTPSLLPPEFWERMIRKAGGSSLAETTIETNPAVLDALGYSSLCMAGFTRVSIGVQSFHDGHLKLLGRPHTADDARMAMELIAATGFRSASADIMYGIPGQTLSGQRKDIEEMLSYRPGHISAYELTLEKGTPMGDRGEKAEEDLCADMYRQTHSLLTENGYIHYEVSSYALGEENVSRHNTSYWSHVPYMGVGPSASSFDGRRRWRNTSKAADYEQAVISGRSPVEFTEELSPENLAHEILALGFRHRGGVDLKRLESLGFALPPDELLETGMVTRTGDVLSADHEGMLFADSLALKASLLLTPIQGV
jgi:putative oxygen-independent coproporphyrinogen III oxidase